MKVGGGCVIVNNQTKTRKMFMKAQCANCGATYYIGEETYKYGDPHCDFCGLSTKYYQQEKPCDCDPPTHHACKFCASACQQDCKCRFCEELICLERRICICCNDKYCPRKESRHELCEPCYSCPYLCERCEFCGNCTKVGCDCCTLCETSDHILCDYCGGCSLECVCDQCEGCVNRVSNSCVCCEKEMHVCHGQVVCQDCIEITIDINGKSIQSIISNREILRQHHSPEFWNDFYNDDKNHPQELTDPETYYTKPLFSTSFTSKLLVQLLKWKSRALAQYYGYGGLGWQRTMKSLRVDVNHEFFDNRRKLEKFFKWKLHKKRTLEQSLANQGESKRIKQL